LRKKIENKILEENRQKIEKEIEKQQEIISAEIDNKIIEENIPQVDQTNKEDIPQVDQTNKEDISQVDQTNKEDATPIPNESVISPEQIKPIEQVEEDDDRIINPFAKPDTDNIPLENRQEIDGSRMEAEQLNQEKLEPLYTSVNPVNSSEKELIKQSDDTPQLYNEEAITDGQTDQTSTREEAIKQNAFDIPQFYNEEPIDATPVKEEKDNRLNKLINPLTAAAAGASVGALSENENKPTNEKESVQITDDKEEKTLLASIVDNLVNVNKSIENVLKFQKDESESTVLPKTFVDREISQPNASREDKNDEGTIFSKILKTLGVGLFLIAPALIRFIKEKVESIKKFFEPAFTFFSDAFEFILNDVPEFFVEDIPNFFLDKFKKLQEKADSFINSAKIMISQIKKSAGEIIVALGQKIKDLPFDAAKDIGQSIIDFGQEMVDDANATIETATIENDEIEKTSELQKVAEKYVKELKNNDKTIENATVIIDREKGIFNIEINYGSGTKTVQNFDFYESMKRGKVIPLGGDDEEISDLNELFGTGKSDYAKRADGGKSKAQRTEESSSKKDAARVPSDMMALNTSIEMNAPDAVPSQAPAASIKDSVVGASGGTVSSGSSSAGTLMPATPAAVPVSSAEQQSSAPSINAGQTITDESLKATDPSLDPSTKQMQQMPKPSSPTSSSSSPGISRNWSIDVVPDPSIAFGSLAEDLFYIRA